MKKRILTTVLLLCFLCSVITLPAAFADNEKHIHPRINFDSALSELPAEISSGSFYLSADLTATADITVNGDVSLCLNGFELDMADFSILISDTGSLSIYDCSENNIALITSSSHGENAMVQNHGNFILESGGLFAKHRTALFNAGNAAMNGGYIGGADADLVQTLSAATFNLVAGLIESAGTGPALRLMDDAEGDNSSTKDYSVGIGTYCNIVGHVSNPGTVVVDGSHGRLVINDGAVLQGTDCPAVAVLAGNFDAYGSSRIWSENESAIVGTGGNVSLYNAIISSDEKYGVDISQDAQLFLSGSLDVMGGIASIHLAEGKLFAMSDAGFYGDVMLSIHTDTDPVEGSKVAVSMPCEQKHASHFLSANPNSSIIYENGVIYNSYDAAVPHYHDGRNYVIQLDNSYNDLVKNNYYLEKDLNRSGFFTGSSVNLCLNGHTINLNSAIKMYPGSTLNIYDCTGQGRIEANNNVIQDINNGDVKIVLHDGLLISHGAAAVKLSGDDTLIVKGGSLESEYEGTSAVEVTGLENSIRMSGGEIKGIHAGIKMQDAGLVIASDAGISGGVYAVDCCAYNSGSLILEGAPLLSGGTADIHLEEKAQLTPRNGFAPVEKISLAADIQGEKVILCAAADGAYGSFFETVDDERSVLSGAENELLLTIPLPVNPEASEILPGGSFTVSAEYTGESAAPVYQWYLRDLSNMETRAIEGAVEATCTAGNELASGQYELFCTISDENAQYISKSAAITVLHDAIQNVSVRPVSELSYSGNERTPIFESSASTRLGVPVSFAYSIDGVSYAPSIPSIGPEPGEYVLFYCASAEGCDSIYGEVSVTITEPDEDFEEPKPEKTRKFNVDIRFIAIMAMVFLDLILLTIYLIIKVKNE